MITTVYRFPTGDEGTNVHIAGTAPNTIVFQPSAVNFGNQIIGTITYTLSGLNIPDTGAPNSVYISNTTRQFTYTPLSALDPQDSRANFSHTFYNCATGSSIDYVGITMIMFPSMQKKNYHFSVTTSSPYLTVSPKLTATANSYIFDNVHLVKTRAWGTNNNQLVTAEGMTIANNQLFFFNITDVASGSPLSPLPPNPSLTPSPTPSISISPTPSVTVTPTPTPSVTPSPTPSISISPTPSVTPTISITPTVTPTKTPSPSVTPTVTPTATPSPTPNPSLTPTPTISITPTITPSVTPTRTVTPTATPSPTVTPTRTITPTPTPSPSYVPPSPPQGVTAYVNGQTDTVFITINDLISIGISGSDFQSSITNAYVRLNAPSGRFFPYSFDYDNASSVSETVDALRPDELGTWAVLGSVTNEGGISNSNVVYVVVQS